MSGFNNHLIKTPRISPRAHENHFISTSLKGKTYNFEEHLYFWENTCWILVKPPPRRENKKDDSHKGACMELGPQLTRLKWNEQHSTPDGHCCFLWIRHRSTRFWQPWIFASVPGPNPIFFFSLSLCWYKGMEEAYSKQYKRYSFSWKGSVHARGPWPD